MWKDLRFVLGLAAVFTACEVPRDPVLILSASGAQPGLAASGVLMTVQTRGGNLLWIRVVGGKLTGASGPEKVAESCTPLVEGTAADEGSEAALGTTFFVVYPDDAEAVVLAELKEGEGTDCAKAKHVKGASLAIAPVAPSAGGTGGAAGGTTSSGGGGAATGGTGGTSTGGAGAGGAGGTSTAATGGAGTGGAGTGGAMSGTGGN